MGGRHLEKDMAITCEKAKWGFSGEIGNLTIGSEKVTNDNHVASDVDGGGNGGLDEAKAIDGGGNGGLDEAKAIDDMTKAELEALLVAKGVGIPHNANKAALVDLAKGIEPKE